MDEVFKGVTPALDPDEAAELDFDVEDEPRRFLTAAEIERLPKPEYQIEDVLVRESVAVLYGPPGSYKSFLALGMALSIATGFRWAGRSVIKGPVLFVAGEGNSGLGARVRAWKEHNHYSGNPDAYFLPCPANLASRAETDRLLGNIANEIAAHPALIIIDTLSRDLAGKDENSQADMSAYIANVDLIRTVTKSAVLLIHHTNASAERERGSTVLRGAADTMIQIKTEDDSIVVTCEKQKDDLPFSKIFLEAIPVADSVVLGVRNGVRPRPLSLTDFETELLKGLNEGFMKAGATWSQWLELFPKKRSSFARGVKSLCERGLVDSGTGLRGSRYTLTTEGFKMLVSLGLTKVSDTESVLVSSFSARLEAPGNETDTDRDYDRWEQQRLEGSV